MVVSCLNGLHWEQAGAAVTPEPEVRAVVLPATGARLMLASDGLWDAVAPKTAAHHVRGMPASKAATELVRLRVWGFARR